MNPKKLLVICCAIGIIVILGVLASTYQGFIPTKNADSGVKSITEFSNLVAPSKKYSIDTKCEMALQFVNGGSLNLDKYFPNAKSVEDISKISPDEMNNAIQAEDSRIKSVRQKYNDLAYDYSKSHGLKWYDEPGRAELTYEEQEFFRQAMVQMQLEILDADPKLADYLDKNRLGNQYVLSREDLREDPECAERIAKSPYSYRVSIQ